MAKSLRRDLLRVVVHSGRTLTAIAKEAEISRPSLHRKLHSDEHGFDVGQAERVAAAVGHEIALQPRKTRRRASAGARA